MPLGMDAGSGEVTGRWGRPQSDAPGVVHVALAMRSRPRFGAEGGVGAEDGRGARRGDEGDVCDGRRSLHLLRAPATLRVVLPVPDRSWLRAEDSEELDTAAVAAARARGGACRGEDAPGARVDRGGWYLLETHLARKEAIKAAPAVGNDHRARRRW
ncbi:hypothetical protein B0H14DRAFT_3065241 [Mycena olivaceomarginata]|nr:hypothetical protein B0H14DRAFT_3065241 [Mycena olivaceomarginata]